MVELKTEHPYNGNPNLIRHWAEDETGAKYNILQKETGFEYGEAIDIYPCRYTYEPTETKQEEEDGRDGV